MKETKLPTDPGSARQVALAFLSAYWGGELSAALALCESDAVIELPKSLSIVTPAPISEVLPEIFTQVYQRFIGGRFDTAIERTVAEGDVVLVEYNASGDLKSGHKFDCKYAVVFKVENCHIVSFRQYTDTQYVTETLLS